MSVIARILVALFFTVLVGYFALNPTLVRHAPETALIKMSFTHGGERVVECRRLSREEMLALPPNMRKREDCPRERHPVRSLLMLDGQVLYDQILAPAGLSGDGQSQVYVSRVVTSGTHRIRVALGDRGGEEFTQEMEKDVTLAPGSILVIVFREESGFRISGGEIHDSGGAP